MGEDVGVSLSFGEFIVIRPLSGRTGLSVFMFAVVILTSGRQFN